MVVKGAKLVNAASGDRHPGAERWVYGVNAVLRRLLVDPGSIWELRLLPNASGRRVDILRAAERASVVARDADERTLRLLTRTDAHQGVAARTGPFRYREFPLGGDDAFSAPLVLDQIQDPHNLGALVRTAAAVRMGAVVIPKHGAVGLTPSAEKVAAGAVNDISVCRVTNICRTLDVLRDRGYWAIALVAREGQNLFEMNIPERPALVLGGETGLRPLVRRSCDLVASIPQSRVVESLNVSVAGAIAMYELLRRGLLDRGQGGW